jgi:hypothetical protein
MVTSTHDFAHLSGQALHEAVRGYWITARNDDGSRLTGAQLGKVADRSERWGRDRIAEARVKIGESSPVVMPSLPPVVTQPYMLTPPRQEPVAVSVPRQLPEPTTVAEKTRSKLLKTWPVWLLMLPAAVAIWGGWVGLGEMAGFGPVRLLPGIYDRLVINTAITLPIGMETYAAYALYVWLSGKAVGKALRFARRSAVAALVVGALGQVAYHVMAAAGVAAAPWWITAGVACLPVAVLGMGAALAHMVRAEADPGGVSAAAAV